MEKPAVMFSAEGFKMFLDFVKEIQQPKAEPGEEVSEDSLVKEYFKRAPKTEVDPVKEIIKELDEETPSVSYDMEQVTQTLINYLAPRWNRVFSNADIHQILGAHGFAYNMRAIPPVMRGVQNRTDKITKVEGGFVYNREDVAGERTDG